MSRYVITRKLMSLSGAMSIQDEAGQERFRVTGKALSLADQLSLQDLAGQELAFIRQHAGLRPRYDISRDGQLCCQVRATALIRQRLVAEVTGAPDIEVSGDLLGMEYQLAQAGQPLASASARWALGAGSYGVDIAPGADEILILAIIVAVEDIHRHEQG